MPITLPKFEESHLFWITACGEIPTADEDLAKWMKEEPDRSAPLATARGIGLVRLLVGWSPSGHHVHFDAFSPEVLSEKLGEPKSTPEEVQKSAERLFGKEINARVTGGFQAQIAELPDSGIVRSLFFRTKIGNIGIKLDGASLSIEGAPVQNISWSPSKSEGDIRITIAADSMKTLISENYLTAAVDLLQQAFDIFILGKAQK